MALIDYKPRQKRAKAKTTLSVEVQKTVKALIITLSTMIAVLSIVFLFTTSQNAQKGYTLQQAKIKNEQLKEQKNILLSKNTNASSFTNLEDNNQLKEMTSAAIKNYVTAQDNRVN